mgnify:CR=1 FL=1
MAKVLVWGFKTEEARMTQNFKLARKLGTAATIQEFEAITRLENGGYEYLVYTDEDRNVIPGGYEGAEKILMEPSEVGSAAQNESDYFKAQLAE